MPLIGVLSGVPLRRVHWPAVLATKATQIFLPFFRSLLRCDVQEKAGFEEGREGPGVHRKSTEGRPTLGREQAARDTFKKQRTKK